MTQVIKYPSTNQFRQVIQNMRNKLTFSHIDETGEVIRKEPESWLVPYTGTVKIHGTNGSVVWHSEDEVVFQSKAQVVEIGRDNAGFAAFMSRKNLPALLEEVKHLCAYEGIEFKFPVEIAGEWAGRGIQKGVAVTEVEPFFSIFRVAVGRDSSGLNWLPTGNFIADIRSEGERIYNIASFGREVVMIDFQNPERVQNELVRLTEEAEAQCPAGKYFGVEGVGEGYVWTPSEAELSKDSGLWFKVKGEKHSVSKVKTLAEVDPVRLENINEFIEYAVTENRLEQGLSEVGLDQKKIGEFIKWVSIDVNKEEGDVLEKNSLTMKDVGGKISTKAREFYMTKLKEV